VRNFWDNHHRFVYYLLQTLPFEAFSGKSAVPGVDRNDLHRLSVVRPPIDEQIAIAEFLDHEIAQLERVFLRIHEVIDRLQEYRTALISAAVTGKIDVRAYLQGGS
jgi:type I restriction enzyme S subunit